MTYVLEKKMLGSSAFFAFMDMRTGQNRWTDNPKEAKQFSTYDAAKRAEDQLMPDWNVAVTELVSPAEGKST